MTMTSAELTAERRSVSRDDILDWIAERGVYAGLLLLVAFNLLVALDSNGLRDRVSPMVGLSYTF